MQSVEVTFTLHATNVALDVDNDVGVSLTKLPQLAGALFTGVMYKKQGVWKLLEVEEDDAKPKNNDWEITNIFHLFLPSLARGRLRGQDVQDDLQEARRSRTANRETRTWSRGRNWGRDRSPTRERGRSNSRWGGYGRREESGRERWPPRRRSRRSHSRYPRRSPQRSPRMSPQGSPRRCPSWLQRRTPSPEGEGSCARAGGAR